MTVYHTIFGEVEITKEDNGKIFFTIIETGKEKSMISEYVQFYASEEVAEKAAELKQELMEAEENEEKEALRKEIEVLTVKVNATIAENGGLTQHEITMRNIANGLR